MVCIGDDDACAMHHARSGDDGDDDDGGDDKSHSLIVRWSDGVEHRLRRDAWTAMSSTMCTLLDGCGARPLEPVPMPRIDSATGTVLNDYIELCYAVTTAAEEEEEQMEEEEVVASVTTVGIRDEDEDEHDGASATAGSHHCVSRATGSRATGSRATGGEPRAPDVFEMDFVRERVPTVAQAQRLGEAANYVDCGRLVDVVATHLAQAADEAVRMAVVAPRRDGQAPTAIEQMVAQCTALERLFGVRSDLSAHEKRAAMRENEWCYDFAGDAPTAQSAP